MTVPKSSREIAAHLRRQIQDGLLAPGDQLPTRAELRDRYGVARQTAYAALNILREEGLVSTRAGIGCFVRDRAPRVRLVRRPVASSQLTDDEPLLQSFTAADAEEWLADVTTSRRIAVAGPELGAELGIGEHEEVLLRVRTMMDDGVIVALVNSCFPRSITRGTVIEDEDTGEGGVFARLKELGYPEPDI